MKSPAEVLAFATEHHVRVFAEGDKLYLEAQYGELPKELIKAALRHNNGLIRELARPYDVRRTPEMAQYGDVWCIDCSHWNSSACGHPDNPFRNQRPLVPRKCRWFQRNLAKL